MARVERELKEKRATDFSARFVCVLAIASPGGETETFRGEVEGRLAFPPRGTKGFGYDPIFIANGMTETFGEIDPAMKHSISHRARAFEKFVAAMKLKAS
jgi:XTP/dITP diphosphohydrolase